MASLDTVGDTVTLVVPNAGEVIDIAISGTYNMTLLLQRENGSPGSGSWTTLDTFSTEDATVADQYTTRVHNESLRLIVTVDTSGTAVALLTDNDDRQIFIHTNRQGDPILKGKESGIVHYGSVSHDGTSGIVNVTDATVSLTASTHAGLTTTLNRAAGVTVTLPAATGTGNKYTIVIGTAATSNANVIQVANATDVMDGSLNLQADTDVDGTSSTWMAEVGDDTITLAGVATTGGIAGNVIECIDYASGFWTCFARTISGGGSEVTPFSAGVS